MFGQFFQLGMDHIMDIDGYDHMLFLLVLCASYAYRQWKTVFILVTAFTLGHSLTLILSALEIFILPSDLIEKLIPVTIFLTGLFNLYFIYRPMPTKPTYTYIVALLFGLIHGMGFSNYFKAILGQSNDPVLPLFAFNSGVEVGQIIIVACIMFCSYVCIQHCRLKEQYWTVGLSIFGCFVSGYLILA